MTRVAVAGAGQWGRNHVRVLNAMPGVRLDWVVDPDAHCRELARELAPRARVVADVGDALRDPRLEALVVASPGPTHGPVARAALRAGKHVLVEKPLTPTAEESWDLVRRARRARRLLGVGHLLLYHPAVRALKRSVARAAFGDVRYVHCQRTNIGRIRHDEGALASLAPHDISVMVHVLERWPVAVSARGARHVQPRWEDVVFLGLRFPGGVLGQVHLSWLEPLKVRRISVVGARAMAVFDDMREDDKLRLVPAPAPRSLVRSGVAGGAAAGARSVRIPAREPLAEELRAFVRSVRSGRPMPTPGEDGARVARVLDGAQRSLERGGREVALRIR